MGSPRAPLLPSLVACGQVLLCLFLPFMDALLLPSPIARGLVVLFLLSSIYGYSCLAFLDSSIYDRLPSLIHGGLGAVMLDTDTDQW